MMAFRKNEAYDISLFEQTEDKSDGVRRRKKKDNVVSMPKEKFITRANAKQRLKQIVAGVCVSAVMVSLVGVMIQGNVQLTELNQQISNANNTLSEQQSLYTQTQMKVEAKLSTAVVEDYAKTKLGMSKADSYQKTYIALSDSDKAEVTKSSNGNLLESIAEAVSNLWS